MDNSVNIVIGGEAGQGLVTVGEVLAKALVRSGYEIVVCQDYQSRVRGGHNTFAIRAAADEVLAPRESIDVLTALDQHTLDLHHPELSECGLMIGSDQLSFPPGNAVKVPLADFGPKKYGNTAALGVIGAMIGFGRAALSAAVRDRFAKKADEAAKNAEVLEKAYDWARGRDAGCLGGLAPAKDRGPRLMMAGNDAVALGALSAGLNFYSFYPMTPATSIALALTPHIRTAGIVVEQAEDEIAAVNMAIGASYAGAVAMTGSAGGGFALMVEGVSLAAMTETPLVIAVAMRPAPATGLPTRTEQADLNLALHAGHGEFPRAGFAPGTVAQCFHLARRAFFLAEKYQGPMFILTDQFIADSYRAVEPFDLDGLEPVRPGSDPAAVPAPYLRYRLSPDGISPRLIPGRSDHLVVADSDEHTEDGHITEDLEIRIRMNDKRLAKGKGLREETVAPEFIGDPDPELLLSCWGSSLGAVLEAARELSAAGQKTAVLHFSQVWPMRPEHFLPALKRARRTVMVEGNATGQLARLIRAETGFEFRELVLRCDGLPFTKKYIINNLTTGKNS